MNPWPYRRPAAETARPLNIQRDRALAARPTTLEPTPSGLLAELRNRQSRANRLVLAALAAEAAKPKEMRNGPLSDLCLDLHAALRPVPVIPGRPS